MKKKESVPKKPSSATKKAASKENKQATKTKNDKGSPDTDNSVKMNESRITHQSKGRDMYDVEDVGAISNFTQNGSNHSSYLHKSRANYSMDFSSDNRESCPRVYEEMIQSLEADIRKHIRIEHQLKLHIESVEDRVEELEKELDKNSSSTKGYSNDKERKEQLEKELSKLRREILDKDNLLLKKDEDINKLKRHNLRCKEDKEKAEESSKDLKE